MSPKHGLAGQLIQEKAHAGVNVVVLFEAYYFGR
jgi:hypothetical protein